MEGKNKKTKVFKWAAVMVLAAMMIGGCKQAQGNSSSEEDKKTETPVTPNTPAAAEKYAVSFEEATLGGKLTAKVDGAAITSGASVEKGKTVTFTAAPIEGYKVEKWELNGKAEPSEKNAYELKVSEKADVKVYFKKNGTSVTKYTVTVSADSNGKVEVTPELPADNTVPKGQELTITAKAKSGYVVEKWTVTPAAALQTGGANGSDTATAKVKVTADTTVNVTFKQQAVTPPPPPTPPAPVDKTYTVNSVNFTMKDIAAVTNGTLGHADYGFNNAVHTVSLTAYRIGETEVTQELWEKVMGNEPSYFDGSSGKEPVSGEAQKKRPVENVSWYQCIAFCNELTKKVPELGESQCVYTVDGHTYGTADAAAKKVPEMDMSKKGFRLPTEAEWDWAAMGGKDYKWSGTNVKGQLINYAWYSDSDGGNANNKTHEVKQKQANGYGLYDMSGNVWEWCWDWYSSSTPTGGQDPTGPADSGSHRVGRGGSWGDDANFAARASRVYYDPDFRYGSLGFRLVCRP